MGAFTSYFLHFVSLIFLATPSPAQFRNDTLPYQEYIQTDTLDLRLSGPSYEVAFYRDGIIFLSTVHEGIGIVPMNHSVLSQRKSLFSNDNSAYSPAGMAFTSDYGICYLSRYAATSEEFMMEKIFEMSVDSGLNSGISQLDFTMDNFRYLHPCLSRDDSLMIFATDRLPTSGGLDLYASRLTSKGWSLPLSLGPSINSNGHEGYPFLDRENNLWFCSTGHSGYGSYDLFVCSFNGVDWESPRNLGSSINTSKDEIGLSIHYSGLEALYTQRSVSEGRALRVSIKESALQQSGIEESADQDLPFILQKLADPAVEANIREISSAEPEVLSDTLTEKPELAIQQDAPDPQTLVFRVQILSKVEANSTPSVIIEGQTYSTFEYFYKGAYRITVGEFDTVQEANEFRISCRAAGFDQAFVAAFRGGKRETDPSVFKN